MRTIVICTILAWLSTFIALYEAAGAIQYPVRSAHERAAGRPI